MTEVRIGLLGGFEVVVDGVAVPDRAWSRRSAASLVKLLALTETHRLHREQVIDALWPDLPVDEAGPRLHKATHFARKALGVPGVLLVLGEVVALSTADDGLRVDAADFERVAATALAGRADVVDALALYRGELLPHDLYEPWAEDARRHVAALHLQLLRAAGRWEELATLDPSDEVAHVQLMRMHAERRDRAGGLRQFERLQHALRRELGLGPGREALALREALLRLPVDGPPPAPAPAPDGARAPVGRERQLASVTAAFAAAAEGHGSTVFVHGEPGTGKSTLLDWIRRSAQERGWRYGTGTASDVEGTWPYAPVLEALADLSRAHPTLMDGLDDTYRDEVERALRAEPAPWSGAGGHQRLFVATAELLRLAAAGPGAVLLVDDVHEADEATLRLLHYLARTATTERLLLVLAHRPQPYPALERVRTSLVERRAACTVELGPLPRPAVRELLTEVLGRAPEPEVLDEVEELSAGVPLQVVELARAITEGAPGARQGLSADVLLRGLPAEVVDSLRGVAVLGAVFDTDEFIALAGVPESEGYRRLDLALASGVLHRTDGGFRLRHAVVRDALLGDLPPHRLQGLHRHAAEALAGLGVSPARIGHHLVRGGDLRGAVPWVLTAADTSAALGAHREALQLVDSVRSAARGPDLARLLLLRADLLLAVSDAAAVPAYREALDAAAPDSRRFVRARLARAASLAGDLETAREALAGLEGDSDDVTLLLARGNVAYFSGDIDGAAEASREASLRIAGRGDWQMLDLVSLQGLVAHDRGEWFTRLRWELARTKDAPVIATVVFDAHLCVAEYLLYGPTPYDEVIRLAAELRATAERTGALRAVAFASALAGEAALLSGDLRTAERELIESAELHRGIAAAAGEAHSLQRLAQLRLHEGDRAEARRLLRQALPLARWAPRPSHLLQRIHGTLILAQDDPAQARDAVERAEAIIALEDFCAFCEVMYAVPATIACADAGDLEAAHRHLDAARRSAALWKGTAWEAATCEAEAHLAAAEGDATVADQLLRRAAGLFADAGQPLDAERSRSLIGRLAVATPAPVSSAR